MEEGELKARLATNLKRIRKEKKWSQLDLAVQADLSEQTIISIEIKRLWPSEKTLSKILTALDVDIATLFRSNQKPNLISSQQTEKFKADVVKAVKDLIDSQISDFLQGI